MRNPARLFTLSAALTGFMVACAEPTRPITLVNPSSADVVAHQATWVRHGLTSYTYIYEYSAFSAWANQPIRLEVRQDTVRSAILISTGTSVQPSFFPTIDALFEIAIGASGRDSLRSITFDPTLGYPTGIDIAAPPDFLSSVSASGLQPLP